MGATKKLMENLLMSFSDEIHISTARFANVAFSNGSLPDGFLKRLENEQPLTAPKDIRRYFVSPEESGQLCMMTCALGDSGNIFFPKLNMEHHELTFTSIAESLLDTLGLKPTYCKTESEAIHYFQVHDRDDTYPVYFFRSHTSGEKKLEEFFTKEEDVDFNLFHSLGVINVKDPIDLEEMKRCINSMQRDLSKQQLSKADIVQYLVQLVPGFNHIDTGKNLDQGM